MCSPIEPREGMWYSLVNIYQIRHEQISISAFSSSVCDKMHTAHTKQLQSPPLMRAHLERADGKSVIFIQAQRIVPLGAKHAIGPNVGHEAIKVGSTLGRIDDAGRQRKTKRLVLVVHEQLEFAVI
jgi:hypothetical protein